MTIYKFSKRKQEPIFEGNPVWGFLSFLLLIVLHSLWQWAQVWIAHSPIGTIGGGH